MTSLGTEIAKLSNPTPQFLDFDDEEFPGASRDLVVDEDESEFVTSSLRSRTAPLLEDVDEDYIGRKVSRKSRGLIFDKDKTKESSSAVKEFSRDYEPDTSGSEENNSSSFEEEEEELSENEVSDFRRSLQNKSLSENEEDESGSSDSAEEDTEKDDMISHFANIDVNNDIYKGNAIKAQLEIWNKLCECRIKLQKLLIIANKLPQTDDLLTIKDIIGDEKAEPLYKGNDSIKDLLSNLLDLKKELDKKTCKEEKSNEEMESLSSSDEGDLKIKEKDEKNDVKKGMKRKYKSEDYSDTLSKKFQSEKNIRNAVIQRWDEKVRLSTGKMTQKSFNSFGNSAVKQIEQIIQDKNRLIKRTQLKRSVYRVLGKSEFSDTVTNESSSAVELESKQDLLLKDYDPQIYDDDDFYRQLLKDIIQSKSFGIDPSVVRKQMELQKIRNKMKRKVDTKASKGRKLRYDVHPKLVNFMAPVQTSTISDDARENLMKCLFGKVIVT